MVGLYAYGRVWITKAREWESLLLATIYLYPIEYRKEFKPPAKDEVVKVRTLDYLNQEPHPASVKSVVTVKVSDLPLADASSKHKLKLLAGPRWSGPESRIVDGKLVEDVDGEIKISSEQFPYRAQNMRWCSDKLQLLLKESNVSWINRLITSADNHL